MSQAEEFDGFITPGGELVSIKDANRIFLILVNNSESEENIKEMLQALACECAENCHFKTACAYIDKILSRADTSDEKARCLLVMGQVLEQANDYRHALETYLRAFDFQQESNETWYFLNNNLAFCLNQVNRHHEAQRHCCLPLNPCPKNMKTGRHADWEGSQIWTFRRSSILGLFRGQFPGPRHVGHRKS
ncbi:MAG: tetratricopeptide repeat protein [Acidobacteriia bacterium]|nr:tetratricopeptide repeat protein [Terriglobia bacterium]